MRRLVMSSSDLVAMLTLSIDLRINQRGGFNTGETKFLKICSLECIPIHHSKKLPPRVQIKSHFAQQTLVTQFIPAHVLILGTGSLNWPSTSQ
jgi:hypothetical protein